MLEQRAIPEKRGILFVDDEEGVREGWKRVLAAEDRRVATAADGASAIRGLAHNPFDLVISDLRMPGLDGLDILEWIHENKPETRFVLITGYGSREVQRKARRLGAFGYLEKPVNPDHLMALAEAALRGDESPWQQTDIEEDELVWAEAVEKADEIEWAEACDVVPTARTGAVVVIEPRLESTLQLTLRDLVGLATAPFVGLAYIVFLPVVGIGAATYGIVVKTTRLIRRAPRAKWHEDEMEGRG